MFGSEAKVRLTAQIFNGQLREPFSLGDWNQGLGLGLGLGLGRIMDQIPEAANGIVGSHGRDYWSYKIISIHGQAGCHAAAAFVAADAVFFDPNYGIFYFDKADDFRQWFGEPGGYYWESNYVRELGDEFAIKSYAPRMRAGRREATKSPS